eukprot:COSAG03_NODE_2083_length_3148_cov_2.934405_6_plen_83_part_01
MNTSGGADEVFEDPLTEPEGSGGEDLYKVEVVRKGEGAGFEPMTRSGGVLCFRASRRCCTEAVSEVGCNSSPGLFGSLLFITS